MNKNMCSSSLSALLYILLTSGCVILAFTIITNCESDAICLTSQVMLIVSYVLSLPILICISQCATRAYTMIIYCSLLLSGCILMFIEESSHIKYKVILAVASIFQPLTVFYVWMIVGDFENYPPPYPDEFIIPIFE